MVMRALERLEREPINLKDSGKNRSMGPKDHPRRGRSRSKAKQMIILWTEESNMADILKGL